LHDRRAFDRIYYRVKLKQHAVSGRVDDPTAVFGHKRVNHYPVLSEGPSGTDLVETHEP
jgi:hypothetical protein